MDKKRLVAHRGDNTNYPENSYASLEAALSYGALFIEFDVQMNADGSLIVIHDTDFKRTANYKVSIFETNNQQLNDISIHQPNKFGERHNPTHVSHLSDILKLLDKYPKAQAFVEIKVESIKHWGLSKVMDALIKELEAHANQTCVISFSDEALYYTQQNSQIRTGFVFYNYDNRTRDAAKKLQADFMICSFKIIPNNALWQGSWQWMVYSINDPEVMHATLQRTEINLVETDDIRLMLES